MFSKLLADPTKIFETMYVLIGLILIYVAFKNFTDKKHESGFMSGLFWLILGVVVGFAKWIPTNVVGILVIIMVIPAILNKVKPGTNDRPTLEYSTKMADKLGVKIFIPAMTMGIFAIVFAVVFKLSALVGLFVGVIVSMLMLVAMNRDNKLTTFLNDDKILLEQIGPICMLPVFLAALGAVFTKAGVGTAVSNIVSGIIPEGNVAAGIVVLAIGMAVFTMIMGNAFAAITVMIVGVGMPFVISQGADPTIIGSIALTCGYCGTLMTPMAANFNIVPVAILEIKDEKAVMKKQIIPALIILAFQIVYMIIAS